MTFKVGDLVKSPMNPTFTYKVTRLLKPGVRGDRVSLEVFSNDLGLRTHVGCKYRVYADGLRLLGADKPQVEFQNQNRAAEPVNQY